MVILLKLMENYFYVRYNKELATLKTGIEKLNYSDFIVKNLFLFENVYDQVRTTYTNFKAKVYWNFGEICNVIYDNLPKIKKKTIFNHLKYQPNNECLIYHIVQYYYSNKDLRKSKILIKVNKCYNKYRN